MSDGPCLICGRNHNNLPCDADLSQQIPTWPINTPLDRIAAALERIADVAEMWAGVRKL